jgi:hypothetical protein
MVEVWSRSLFCVSVVSYGVYEVCSSVLLRDSLINFVTTVMCVCACVHMFVCAYISTDFSVEI